MEEPLGAITENVQFDFSISDDLITAFRTAASNIESQEPSRASYVSHAMEDFAGPFSELFRSNANTASADAVELITALRDTANYAEELARLAREENKRRQTARDYFSRHDDWWEKGWDWLVGVEDPPVGAASEPLKQAVEVPPPGQRHTPQPGTSLGGAAVSSARPAHLLSFATSSGQLNAELSGRDRTLRQHLDDFARACSYGSLDAGGVVDSLGSWLQANDQDVAWGNTVGNTFAACGGSTDAVASLSGSSLLAALAAQNVTVTSVDLEIGRPSALGSDPTLGYTLDPVNTSTGNFIEPEIDLSFESASAGLTFSRMYNSLDTREGVFGPGWSSILDSGLSIAPEGVRWRKADGREIFFPRLGDGWGQAAHECYWLSEQTAESALPHWELPHGYPRLMVVQDNGGSWWAFSVSGELLAQGDGPGSSISVVRDSRGRPVLLKHARGRSVRLESDGMHVTALEASDGRRAEFLYSNDGLLVQVNRPDGERHYEWGPQRLIETVKDGLGQFETQNSYDDHGRVVCQMTPFGREVHFSYLPGGVVAVADKDGTRSNSWIADGRGRLVGIIDSDGHRQSMAYDRQGNLVMATERDGAVTVHQYDSRGRRVRTVNPDGTELSYGWDQLDRLTTTVDASGAVTTLEYSHDSERQPSKVHDGLGGVTTLDWQNGLLAQAENPVGLRVELAYDESGDLVCATDSAGAASHIVRDIVGRPVETTSATGAKTTFGYDNAGRMVMRKTPDGSTWHLSYDAAGHLSRLTNPLGDSATFGYGVGGQMVSVVDPLGRETVREFDVLGNVSGVQLPDGASWSFNHDALSRLREITDPAGGRWLRDYGVDGHLNAMVDPTGARQTGSTDRSTGVTTVQDAFGLTSTRHDPVARTTTHTGPDDSAKVVTCDAAGNVVEALDAEGALTTIGRDVAGRVVAVSEPGGNTTHFEYDGGGRPWRSTDPEGAVVELVYDLDSRVIERCRYSLDDPSNSETERLRYDVMGRLVWHERPGEGVTQYAYDALGQVTLCRDPWNGTRRFRYDAAGQLVEATNGLGGRTSYSYDKRGRLNLITDPLGGTTVLEHNELDQVVKATDPLGRTTTAFYDKAGRQLSQTDPMGHVTEWKYDRDGRNTEIFHDNKIVSSVEYSVADRTSVITDHTHPSGEPLVHRLEYNRRGQLIARSRGNECLRWEYDSHGSRTAFIDIHGRRTNYSYDRSGRLVGVKGPESGEWRLEYDGLGHLASAGGNHIKHQYAYVDGNLTKHVTYSDDRKRTATLEWDSDEHISAVDIDGAKIHYSYDAANQLVGLTTNEGQAVWEFDISGRMTRETRVDGTKYQHEYDAAGQLLQRRQADSTDEGVTSYRYDGLGRRVEQVHGNGDRTCYGWGPLGYLAELTRKNGNADSIVVNFWVDALGELGSVGNQDVWCDTASPLHPLINFGEEQSRSIEGTHGDAVHHTTALHADDPWAIAGLVPGMGSAPGAGLTSQGSLAIGGLEWLGARVYDSASRSFLSTDPLMGTPGAAWGSNPYSFAGNNPLAFSDPTGLRPATDADLEAYVQRHGSHWEYLVAAGLVLVAVAAMFVPGLNVIVVGAIVGATTSAAFSIVTQKVSTGDVDWGKVGVDALVGAVVGAATGGAGLLGKAVTKGGGLLFAGGFNGVIGMGSNAFSYLSNHGWKIEDGREFSATIVSGGFVGFFSALGGPAGGSVAKNFGYKASGLFGKWAGVGISSVTSAAGSFLDDALAGREFNPVDAAWDAAFGGLSTAIPVEKIPGLGDLTTPHGTNTLPSANLFLPNSWKGLFNFQGKNTVALWSGAATGELLSRGVDAFRDWIGI